MVFNKEGEIIGRFTTFAYQRLLDAGTPVWPPKL